MGGTDPRASEGGRARTNPIDQLQQGLMDAEATGHLVTEEQKERNALRSRADVLDMALGTRDVPTMFGDVYTSETPGTDAAAAVAEGLLSLAGARGASGSVKGASRTANTLIPMPDSLPATRKAKEMRLEGVLPERIWRETGRTIGPEGGVRREIQDNAMSIYQGLQPGDVGAVGEMVDHPKLFRHFPWLAEKEMRIVGDTDRAGRPVARTTGTGGYELSTAVPDVRSPLAKLFQYDIATQSGLPPAMRHGRFHVEKGLEDARGAADMLDPKHPADRAMVDDYLKVLGDAREVYDTMGADAQWARKGPVSDAAARLSGRNAGNVEAAQVARRATVHPDQLSTYPYARKLPGVKNHLPSYDDLLVLPPEGLGADALMEFIRNWRELGSGRAVR